MIEILVLGFALQQHPQATYTVRSGDTLSSIAAARGTSWPALCSVNHLPDCNLIYPAQVLKISAPRWTSARLPETHWQHLHHLAVLAEGQRPHDVTWHSAPQQQHSVSVSSTGMPGWASCIVPAESGGNPQAVNPSSGAGGLFQDLPSTWNGFDGYPNAQSAPVSVQIQFNNQLEAAQGLSPWAADGCPGT